MAEDHWHLAIERARVDMILDRDSRVIITDGTGRPA